MSSTPTKGFRVVMSCTVVMSSSQGKGVLEQGTLPSFLSICLIQE